MLKIYAMTGCRNFFNECSFRIDRSGTVVVYIRLADVQCLYGHKRLLMLEKRVPVGFVQ